MSSFITRLKRNLVPPRGRLNETVVRISDLRHILERFESLEKESRTDYYPHMVELVKVCEDLKPEVKDRALRYRLEEILFKINPYLTVSATDHKPEP